jgi:hypothetical protein
MFSACSSRAWKNEINSESVTVNETHVRAEIGD